MRSRTRQPAWESALCRGAVDAWFPKKGDNLAIKRAKATCMECNLLAPCFAGAFERGERWGVWGAATERDFRDARIAMRLGSERARLRFGDGTDEHQGEQVGTELVDTSKETEAA